VSDLSKPNHYHDDNLGDPATCTGDHNHPVEGLPDEVLERAKEATCGRCGEQIVGSPSMAGTVMVQFYVPATSARGRGFLCGACGLLFREFIDPSLADNPAYQSAARQLREMW
jgi:hypothetical protein